MRTLLRAYIDVGKFSDNAVKCMRILQLNGGEKLSAKLVLGKLFRGLNLSLNFIISYHQN